MTKAQIKFIQALAQQKYRKAYNSYIVEGDKNVREWLHADTVKITRIIAQPTWLHQHEALLGKHPEAEIIEAADFELSKISLLTQAQQVLITVAIPPEGPTLQLTPGNWALYLEKIQDPGNMGTILRVADWFGIRYVLLSEHCADIYNPKVVQASMGSLLRISPHRLPVDTLQPLLQEGHILYAAALQGENLFTLPRMQPGIVAIGNESQGLSDKLLQHATHKIAIPRYGGAESLNAGVATGIICAEIMRQCR